MLLGVHESTISRAIKDKYIYCDKGFILLSDLIPKGTEDNSVDSIKETIKEVIDNEDKKKPLSDQKITNLLKDKGIEISRRTVAKYRSELNIPDASGRKYIKSRTAVLLFNSHSLILLCDVSTSLPLIARPFITSAYSRMSDSVEESPDPSCVQNG